MAASKDDNTESVQFFEGVEKLLEIWFTSGDGQDRKRDLREIPREKWESMLKIVRCEIISFCRNDQVDAYVLSESSMFVSKRRLILKTCGTTTPLQCLEALLDLVEQYTGFDEVEDLFYSRKNYKRPELQISPHQAFEDEVSLLDTVFPDGEAYCLGDADRDCWYLYTLNREKASRDTIREPDQTLEILMTNLDPDVMSIFTRDVCSSAAEATEKSGIDKLIPSMVIDDFLFEPCGYSMNGVSKSGSYMTIHITPEPEFSYVSFESNIPEASYEEVIRRVLETFKPGKFVVTIFANKESVAAETPRELEQADYLNFEDGPSVPLEQGTDRATKSSPLSRPNFPKKSVNPTDSHPNRPQANTVTKQSPEYPRNILDFATSGKPASQMLDDNSHALSQSMRQSNNNNEEKRAMFKFEAYRSKRSTSSPQLTTKPLTRSKVYRKTSLKSTTTNSKLNVSELKSRTLDGNRSSHARITQIGGTAKFPVATTNEFAEETDKTDSSSHDTKVKWNTDNVHITCNPLSSPYPYSTPFHKVERAILPEREQPDEEPKSHSCGSFLPILSLIPQTMVSFQYLGPKMKFSWWRNKIS